MNQVFLGFTVSFIGNRKKNVLRLFGEPVPPGGFFLFVCLCFFLFLGWNRILSLIFFVVWLSKRKITKKCWGTHREAEASAKWEAAVVCLSPQQQHENFVCYPFSFLFSSVLSFFLSFFFSPSSFLTDTVSKGRLEDFSLFLFFFNKKNHILRYRVLIGRLSTLMELARGVPSFTEFRVFSFNSVDPYLRLSFKVDLEWSSWLLDFITWSLFDFDWIESSSDVRFRRFFLLFKEDFYAEEIRNGGYRVLPSLKSFVHSFEPYFRFQISSWWVQHLFVAIIYRVFHFGSKNRIETTKLDRLWLLPNKKKNCEWPESIA